MSKNMLIVDDSRFSRLSLRKVVTGAFEGWAIEDAADGEEALAIAARMPFDVVFIDYNMPGDDGLTVGKKLRLLQPQARLAMVTANVQGSLAEEVRANGIHFIPKPVTTENIVAFLTQEVP
ncbi:chemotaxis protein CheY [mine drainage metagenome]|uniref:Chemotaxis protein CheY n=1 Tax=mine drainage metagenome TaxID=410659 RepID=A0A1J5RPV8_9ZZZZ